MFDVCLLLLSDSGEPAVGSSKPEPEPSNGVTEGPAAVGEKEALPDQPLTSSGIYNIIALSSWNHKIVALARCDREPGS